MNRLCIIHASTRAPLLPYYLYPLTLQGSSVVADNLLYPGAPDFIELMESSPEEYDWTPHATKLEYALADRDDLVGVAIMKT